MFSCLLPWSQRSCITFQLRAAIRGAGAKNQTTSEKIREERLNRNVVWCPLWGAGRRKNWEWMGVEWLGNRRHIAKSLLGATDTLGVQQWLFIIPYFFPNPVSHLCSTSSVYPKSVRLQPHIHGNNDLQPPPHLPNSLLCNVTSSSSFYLVVFILFNLLVLLLFDLTNERKKVFISRSTIHLQTSGLTYVCVI